MENASPETQFTPVPDFGSAAGRWRSDVTNKFIDLYLSAHSNDFKSKIRILVSLDLRVSQLLKIIEIPDMAAQRFVVENLLLISSRENIRNSFDDRMTELVLEYALIKIQRDRDVGGPSARSDGPDLPMDMAKEDVPAEQKNPHLPFRDIGGPSTRVDGLPDVPIDMPREDNVPAEQKNLNLPFKEVVKSAADFIKKEGLTYLSNPSTNDPDLIWAKTIIDVAKILGYAFTAAGHGVWNYNNKLSRFFLKAGGVATASAVILHLVLPLQPVVAWIVGPVAWLIVVAVILLLSD